VSNARIQEHYRKGAGIRDILSASGLVQFTAKIARSFAVMTLEKTVEIVYIQKAALFGGLLNARRGVPQ
jgi:hypothetical protein